MGIFRIILNAFTILEATTIEEALRKFIENDRHVNLMIADVILPVGSGIHAALVLRSEVPELPIILTSGYPQSMWSDQGITDLLRLGPDSVQIIQKPFLPATLLATISGLLQQNHFVVRR
jgi:DNA-binding response OmpR family regulator